MSFKYILRKGDSGQEVARLQTKIDTSIDGKYGSDTESAVKEYQRDNNLGIDVCCAFSNLNPSVFYTSIDYLSKINRSVV